MIKPKFDEYQIALGDTLSSLAKRRLGDGKRWREIFECNRDLIDGPDYLPVGLVIRVPLPAPQDTAGP